MSLAQEVASGGAVQMGTGRLFYAHKAVTGMPGRPKLIDWWLRGQGNELCQCCNEAMLLCSMKRGGADLERPPSDECSRILFRKSQNTYPARPQDSFNGKRWSSYGTG